MKNNRFRIVVPSYNAHPWLEKCLVSIEAQTYTNYSVCIIDDASTQSEPKEIIRSYAEKNGWEGVYNETNLKQLPNLLNVIDYPDEEIVVIVDGDDWLFNDRVFEKLNEAYQDETWLTFGQFVCYKTGEIGCSTRPPDRIFKKRIFRRKPWYYSHLKTFKSFLWKNIPHEDLQDANGNFYGASWDLAAMFPMVEMADSHVKHIPEILYVHNDMNPISDHRVNLREQQRNNKHIRARSPYAPLSHR